MDERHGPPKEAGSAWLAHPGGLHARPAIQITKLAKRFQASIRLARSAEGPWVDAKSIARVMAMKTPSETMLYFFAEGEDATRAVREMVLLVQRNFESVPDGGE